ncbi:MAG: glycosyltransferase family 4 protein [Deltaproteobacteria bacterium]|nr:glycosyltransferase family 4 protein [Deltaproteobacteria bacterium]
MKVLHTVEFYHPSKGGAQEAIRQISEALVRLGHEVTVATTFDPDRNFSELNGVKIKEFSISGNWVSGVKGDLEGYRNFVRNSNFDIVLNYAAQQWTTDALLDVLPEIKSKKILVPCGFSGLYNSHYKNYFQKMREWLLLYDSCIFLSRNYRDYEFAKIVGIKNIQCIPNGASRAEFELEFDCSLRRQLGIPNDAFLILHVGSFTKLKGQYEALKIFSLSKIRNSYFLLIGNTSNYFDFLRCKFLCHFINIKSFFSGSKKKVLIRNLPRESTVAAFHEADLFLFPSRIECSPLVLFEAMASKCAFLVSRVGNAEEIISLSNGGFLIEGDLDPLGYSVPNLKNGAKKLSDLWQNPTLRNESAQNGFLTWQESFTWESIAVRYEHLYKKLISEKI